LAVVHDGVYYDTLTDEAARAIANIVLNSWLLIQMKADVIIRFCFNNYILDNS
jgi:hypothetical protein